MTLPQVILKPRKSQPFLARHPWVRDSAIDRVEGPAVDGGEIDLLSDRGRWIARGLYNSKSKIAVRLYTWQPEESFDEQAIRTRLAAAIRLRRLLPYGEPNGAERLVFSEADGLSGLIIDRFGSHIVIQPTSLGMAQRLVIIAKVVNELLHPAGISIRCDAAALNREAAEVYEGHYSGAPPEETVFIEEHGLRYGVQLLSGQKTGFYLDQRENRLTAARYMRDRRVLDMCCYTGGFGLNSLRHGHAKHVIGIDSSDRALELARNNATINGLTNIEFVKGECFATLQQFVEEGRKFEAVVLDPPKFARGRSGLNEALRAYHRINQLAVNLLEPNGILVTCSCSGGVTRQHFADMLHGVSDRTKKTIHILEQRGAAPDHPTSTLCPETEYLKCFICYVA